MALVLLARGPNPPYPVLGHSPLSHMYNCHGATFLPHHLDPRCITAPGGLSKERAGGRLIFVPGVLSLGCRKEPNLLLVTWCSLRWGLQVTGIPGICKQKKGWKNVTDGRYLLCRRVGCPWPVIETSGRLQAGEETG